MKNKQVLAAYVRIKGKVTTYVSSEMKGYKAVGLIENREFHEALRLKAGGER